MAPVRALRRSGRSTVQWARLPWRSKRRYGDPSQSPSGGRGVARVGSDSDVVGSTSLMGPPLVEMYKVSAATRPNRPGNLSEVGTLMGMLDGKVAIVTGAGHGVGRGHAMELAKHGATVVVNDLGGSVDGEGTSRAADDTVALVEARGGTAVANYGDVSDHEQCGALVQQALDAYGRLDIVVNNAGIVRDAAIWNMPVENFDLVLSVHLRGTWSMCHHAAKHFRAMSKAGEPVAGRIINTTSGAGLTGNFGQTSYATAKAAIVGLTLTLAQELASSGRHRQLRRARRGSPASPPPCRGCPTRSSPTRSATTSSTPWTRRTPRRSWPGSPPTTPAT